MFDQVFNSFHLQLAKPDPLCFEKMLEEIQLSGAECFFVDDKQSNTDSARDHCGIRGYVYRNDPDELRKRLKQLEILN